MAFENFEPVCTAPCRAASDPNAIYIVAGEGVTPSPKFQLPPGPEASLRVHAGSKAKRAWGMVSLYGGVAVAVLGGGAFALGVMTVPDPKDSKYSGSYAYG